MLIPVGNSSSLIYSPCSPSSFLYVTAFSLTPSSPYKAKLLAVEVYCPPSFSHTPFFSFSFSPSPSSSPYKAKLLAVDVYRWMGPPLRGILEKSLKPVQMKELDDEWGKLSGGPAVPNRRLRSQQVCRVQYTMNSSFLSFILSVP